MPWEFNGDCSLDHFVTPDGQQAGRNSLDYAERWDRDLARLYWWRRGHNHDHTCHTTCVKNIKKTSAADAPSATKPSNAPTCRDGCSASARRDCTHHGKDAAACFILKAITRSLRVAPNILVWETSSLACSDRSAPNAKKSTARGFRCGILRALRRRGVLGCAAALTPSCSNRSYSDSPPTPRTSFVRQCCQAMFPKWRLYLLGQKQRRRRTNVYLSCQTLR